MTNIKINLYPNSKTRLKGKASITIDNSFVVHSIKIIEGENGFFIAMPSTKNSKGVYVDIAHPINKETREVIESNIIKDFYKILENENKNNHKINN
ncbi:MAG: SpoVG family protein [Candidatus Phytoplasma stylosanthis]|uniref:SpoVG family protein n=1 Tax=Candidatus Phytoplasma stylosanthis TaxID=2798314 RepID=UPI00293A9AE6|nr:SpoVG family protein [Candidatus Phytoplasma stylosanthis]MDV3168001.1 SpoVG family protein [Candidatus Phytoplasma stylosanthis]MDV3171071.1 SpoVG family protein [Candidatus Phytoplasma stylosanthis]MDV3174267.1 SpoVG family protein [Candidatus Phytoplasma stylosanthis]MDV3202619.1 SpoVG family protein [Candidatus Phytoplasma stylosanthis]